MRLSLLVLGVDGLLPSVGRLVDGRPAFIVQSLIGSRRWSMLSDRRPPPTPRVEPRTTTYAALALLGVTATAMELPSAVPYVGAIALLTSASLSAAQCLPLLVVYNAIFVLPPVLLLLGHIVYGRRLEARYADLRRRLHAGAQQTMLWIKGLAGGGLLTGVLEYIVRFVMRPN